MSDIKVRNDTIYLKSQKGQLLAEYQIEFINKSMQDCILPIDFEKGKKGKFKIFINLSGRLSLRNFLSVPVNKKSFAALLKNILDSLEKMRSEYLDYHSALLDVDLVAVSPEYNGVIFPYVPVDGFDSGYSLREFLMNILDCAQFYKDEDTNYINEYKRILYEKTNFSLFDLNEYVEILINSNNAKKVTSVVCKNCGSTVPDGIAYCPSCGKNVNKPVSERIKSAYTPYDVGKIIVDEPKQPDVHISIRRNITAEVTDIKRFPFYIGRDAANDLVIDEKSIGRRHAAINYENGLFYIYDNKTMNHTYVNNIMVNSGGKSEIKDGNEVRIADIAFVVSVI